MVLVRVCVFKSLLVVPPETRWFVFYWLTLSPALCSHICWAINLVPRSSCGRTRQHERKGASLRIDWPLQGNFKLFMKFVDVQWYALQLLDAKSFISQDGILMALDKMCHTLFTGVWSTTGWCQSTRLTESNQWLGGGNHAEGIGGCD